MALLNMEGGRGVDTPTPGSDDRRAETLPVLARIRLVARQKLVETAAQEAILRDPHIRRLSNDIPPETRLKLATLYATEWSREGVPVTQERAEDLFQELDLDETFVVEDEDGEIQAMVNTVPVSAETLRRLMLNFPTYRSIEKESARQKIDPAKKPTNPTFRICFSIVARRETGKRFRVQNGGEKTESLSRFLLRSIPRDGAYKAAFSRMGGVDTRNMTATRHLLSIRDRKDATSMHEGFGGTTIAVVEGSRPEDTDGGGANTWIVYAEDSRITPNPEPEIVETITTPNGGEINILDNYRKIVL